MAHFSEILHRETVTAAPVGVAGFSVTPESKALTLRLPYAGFVWNRPAAVIIERDGDSERIPIVDVTRIAQLSMFGMSIILSLVVLILRVRSKE